MFLNAAMMDFASKIILLLLLIEIPCFIANSKQLRQKRLTQIDINTINTLQNLWTVCIYYLNNFQDSFKKCDDPLKIILGLQSLKFEEKKFVAVIRRISFCNN